MIVTGDTEAESAPAEPTAEAEPAEIPVADVIKSLVHFLANRPTHMPLWQYEDITAKGTLDLLGSGICLSIVNRNYSAYGKHHMLSKGTSTKDTANLFKELIE